MIRKDLSIPPNRISSLVIVVLGFFLLYSARSLPFGSPIAPDSGFFPIVLALLLCGLGVVLFVSSFRSEEVSVEFNRGSIDVLIGGVAFIAYALLLEQIGFLICSALILILVMRLFGGMTWRTILFVCLPSVLAAYFGFLQLGVPLPRGIL